MSQIIHPSPVAHKDIDLTWMVGRTVCFVSFHEPTLWSFNFGQKVCVGVECLWRIVTQGRVALTSQDHGHQFGLPAPIDAVARYTELFSKRRVSAVELRDDTVDLLIEFTDDLRLEVMPDSAGYESWQLHAPSTPIGRLRRHPLPPHSLVHHRLKPTIFLPNPPNIGEVLNPASLTPARIAHARIGGNISCSSYFFALP
jgi:hypothetical protein